MILLQDIAPIAVSKDSIHAHAQEALSTMVHDPQTFWTTLGEQAIQFGLKVLAAFIVYIVGFYAIKYIKRLLTHLFARRKTEATLAGFITSLVSISLTILLVVVTISTLGVNTSSFAALLTGGSMAIALTLQGTVQNFAGGMILLIFKPFKAGDFISSMGVTGTVTEVSIAATKVLTPDGRIIVLPNGALANSTIDNYSAKSYRRVEIEVSLAYGTNAEACKEAIMHMFEGDERILTAKDGQPDPFVALKSLNDSNITFVTRVWVKSENYWDVYFGYTERFYTELPKLGFCFDYPHVEVLMKK